MNFGYSSMRGEPIISLQNDDDEDSRMYIQLYYHTLQGIDLAGKKVLEVGSGRGGGADFIARYLGPSSLTGVDFSKNAVELCNEFYHIPTLHFVLGNAEKLPFDNDTFDVVYNVESSHCYANMPAFLAEVARVLKPGGIFAWADLRLAKDIAKLEQEFAQSPLEILSKEEITPNVVKALELLSDVKELEIKRQVPFIFRNAFSEFAGVRNSKIYNGFKDGSIFYWQYRFRKPLD